MTQPTLDFDRPLPFGGKTFNAELDGARLTSHLQKVYDLMKDGKWRTLKTISITVGCSEASASARLRDLRKPWAGQNKVERKRIKETGLWMYRVIV